MNPTMDVLQVIVIREGGFFSAQCLQYDIGAEAETLKDVLYEFGRAVAGHISICESRQVEPFTCLPAAPAAYWKKWSEAIRLEPEQDAAFREVPGKAHLLPQREVRLVA